MTGAGGAREDPLITHHAPSITAGAVGLAPLPAGANTAKGATQGYGGEWTALAWTDSTRWRPDHLEAATFARLPLQQDRRRDRVLSRRPCRYPSSTRGPTSRLRAVYDGP
jgi:hypothetical protein